MKIVRRPMAQDRKITLIDGVMGGRGASFSGDPPVLTEIKFGFVYDGTGEYRYDVVMTPEDAREVRAWINQQLGKPA